MSHRARTTVIIVVLLMFTSIVLDANVAAQTPSAISRFKAGVIENQKGNFDLAIEDFTLAIEINSHPTKRFSGKRALSNSIRVQ